MHPHLLPFSCNQRLPPNRSIRSVSDVVFVSTLFQDPAKSRGAKASRESNKCTGRPTLIFRRAWRYICLDSTTSSGIETALNVWFQTQSKEEGGGGVGDSRLKGSCNGFLDLRRWGNSNRRESPTQPCMLPHATSCLRVWFFSSDKIPLPFDFDYQDASFPGRTEAPHNTTGNLACGLVVCSSKI
jgi:hypothetical protein